MNLKQMAGEKATEYIKDGMVVGLGTGSTVRYTILKLGNMVAEGLDIIGIPTSIATERLAKDAGIRISSLEEHPEIDLTVDGADEVDPNLDLIKGGGGALLREKIVASASKREIIVADGSKLVNELGEHFPLPVEVVPFSEPVVFRRLKSMGLDPQVRKKDGKKYLTDGRNIVIDCRTGPIADGRKMESELNLIPGVVENGLFMGIADIALISKEKGVRVFRRIS